MKKYLAFFSICLLVSASIFAGTRGKWLSGDEYQIQIMMTNKATQSAAKNAGRNDAIRQVSEDFSDIIVKTSKGKINKPVAQKIVTQKYSELIRSGLVSNEKYEPRKGTYIMLYTVKGSQLKLMIEKEGQQ